MTIWKFPLTGIGTKWPIMMPKGAEILSVQNQMEGIFLWALCDKLADTEMRYFIAYGTGREIPDDPGVYIGTVQMASGALIWHVFEVEA